MSERNSKQLFLAPEMAAFAMLYGKAKKAARWIPLMVFWLGLLGLIQAFVGYVEWEIAYQVFDFVSGDEGYWSATTMAFTGILMIIGFHVLAHNRPKNAAVIIVNFLATVLVPVYALGLGLLVMAILFSDRLADMIASVPEFTLGAAAEVAQESWLDFAFEYIGNPAAVGIFCIATGGLAIVNLFISHHLISAITKGVTVIFERRTRYGEAKQDYAIILESQKQFNSISSKRVMLAGIGTEHLASEIAAEVLVTIQDAVGPHKEALKKMEYQGEPSRFALPDAAWPDPKQIAGDIAKIEAITVDDIFKSLS